MVRTGGWACRGGVALALWGWVMTGVCAGPAGAQSRPAGPLAVRGASPTLPSGAYDIDVASSAVRVDARMDEPAWSSALRVPIAFEVSPGENTEAPVRTECRLTYDDAALYLACEASDPRPDRIRAFLTDRDGIDMQDRIVLTLDPFLDQRRAFQFGVSPLGVQSDAILAQQGGGMEGPDAPPVDPSWDATWSSAGRLTPGGYVVEAAIPFASLRFPSGDGPQTWGMVLTRWWPRSAEVELRSAPLDRGNSCVLCQADRLAGFEGISPGHAIALAPTLTASRLDEAEAGRLVAGPTASSFGLDGQWGVSSDLTMNLTVNPDFSQVEADVAQLDVNNRFALFFPEKRPFFMEGADFFATPIQAVFTRSIAEPTVGAKLSGKLGGTALGALVARDRANNLLLPGSRSSETLRVEQEVTTTLARARRDVGSSSSVGALFTSRTGEGYRNLVGGVDVFARPIPSVTLQAQALRSLTDYPSVVSAQGAQPEGAFRGTSALLTARWSVRDWAVFGNVGRRGEGFRADAGFVPQAGFRSHGLVLSRRFWGGADRWFSQLRFDLGTWEQRDLPGHVLDGGWWLGAMYSGPAQSSIGIWPNFVRKYDAGRSYGGMLLTYADARIRPSGSLGLGVNLQFGDDLDYANGGMGRVLRLAPALDVRLGRHLEASVAHTYQRLDREGARVFTADLTQVRAVYSFSARSFVRSVLQRRSVSRSARMNGPDADPESRWRLAQITYGYKVDPQTVLFLGYGESRQGRTDPEGNLEPLAPDARSFFLKLGYAWRP